VIALSLAASNPTTASAEVKDETSLMLSDLIQSWDAELHGLPYQPSYENFCRLSYPLQSALLKRITEYLGELANPPNATA
jgi:hypothetical protein